MKDKYLTVQELSERLGIAVGTLNNWRSKGKGVPYYKCNGVRYPLVEVERFEAELTQSASL